MPQNEKRQMLYIQIRACQKVTGNQTVNTYSLWKSPEKLVATTPLYSQEFQGLGEMKTSTAPKTTAE